MNSTELRTSFSLAFVYVLRMLGLFMVMPVLAISAKQYPDYSAFLVGLAIGGYGLTQALLQIPMGVLSDKIGRKPVIVMGLAVFALGSLLAASADSLMWVVIGRFLQGAGAIAGAVMALAGDLSRESQRPKVMAVIGISIGFSFYLALFLGPFIATRFGLEGIFLITGILASFCILLVIWAVPKAQKEAPQGDTLPVVQDLKRLISHPQLWRLNVSVLILHMLITLLFVQFPLILQNLNWPFAQHWQAYLIILLLSILGLVCIMAMAKKFSELMLMINVAGLALVFAALVFSQHSLLLVMALVCLFFSCFNYLEANFPAMVSNIAPAGKKGSAMGMYASFQFLGAFLGGLLSGSISELLSNQSVFILASIICVVWLWLIRGLKATNRLKRYTLRTTHPTSSITYQQLAKLEGLLDIRTTDDKQILYIKAEQGFDIQQARMLLNLKD
ncbi:MFS transporter [Paraglaciecola aestuariivivens]